MKNTEERRAALLSLQQEYESRLARIKDNVQRGFSADSEERAKELEDQDVVDALGNEASAALDKVRAALARLERGEYGNCVVCGREIQARRLDAFPYASRCIDCASEASADGN